MSTAPASAVQPPLSEAARVINTFVAPSSTFLDIRRKQSWWVPWLLSSIFSLVFVVVMGQKIGYEQIIRNELAKNPSRAEQVEKLPPEQRQRQMEISTKMVQYISYTAPVTNLIVSLVIAGILLGVFNFGMGTEITFGQSLAIVFYGMLPFLISSVLGIVSLMIGVDPEGFNARNPVASNPAYFMDPLQHKFVYGLLSAVDVFSLWCVVLLGIGYASVSKLKRSTAIVTILGCYLLFKVIAAGISAL